MSNLPVDLTTFVGRRQEIQSVKDLFASTRLVTLLGMGGVGKTRLAGMIGRELRRALPQDVYMVDLAPVRGRDAQQVAAAIAAALGLQTLHGESPVADVAEHLSGWRALLILDNCEHLIDAAAEVTDILMHRCDHLRVLATSRRPLCIPGEFTYAVPPLPTPDLDRPVPSVAALEQIESVRLFLDRAVASSPEFTLSKDNRVAVAELVQRLEGIPLFLELAAARSRMLSPQQILDRLADPYRLLSSHSRTGPARHQNVGALVEWSLDLCDPEEQRLWAQLAVFPRDFDADAAEQILAEEGTPPAKVLDLLTGLVNHSLVVPRPHARQVRYAIPHALRDYAEERVSDAADLTVLKQRHLDYFQHLSARANTEWFGQRQVEWCGRLRDEHLNLRAAFDHAFSQRNVAACLDIVEALSITWFTIGSFAESHRCVDLLLAIETGPTRARNRALRIKALLAGYAGDPTSTREAGEECKALAERLGEDRMYSHSIQHLGVASLLTEGPQAAMAFFEESVRMGRRIDDKAGIAACLFRWGQCQLQIDEPAKARVLLEEAEEICRESGEHWFRAYALWSLALASARLGDAAGAMELIRASLRLSQTVHNTIGISQALEVLALALADDATSERGAEMLGAGSELRKRLGGSLVPLLAPVHQLASERLRHNLGERRYTAAVARGQSFSSSDAVAIALAERKQSSTTVIGAPALTKREREVADLIAEGLSNKDIAGTLFIARRTVEGHVENIMNKFGYNARSQIAAWVAGEYQHKDEALNERQPG